MKKVLVIGSLNCDYVINVPKMPKLGETLSCDGFEMVPGGKGANQAYAIGRLGGSVGMLGTVGGDGAGDMLRENLRAVGRGRVGAPDSPRGEHGLGIYHRGQLRGQQHNRGAGG